MINYKKIIDNLKDEQIIQLLHDLGAEDVVERGNAIICNTICHNIESGSQKLYYYKNSHAFMCYTECGSMSFFAFLRHYYELRGIKYDWYTDILQVVLKCAGMTLDSLNKPTYTAAAPLRERYETEQKIVLPEFSPNVLGVFQKYYPPEWLNDHISKEAMDKFNILYSISQNKIIIPHYDVDYRLVGIRGRALNEWEIENIGKYTPVEVENIWYSHKLSLNLYGLAQNKENIKRSGYVVVCEAEKSVLQAESFSRPNCCVAVCGSNLNRFQIKLLMETVQPQEIIIAFDNEEKDKSNDYFNKLYKIADKYKNYANLSFIYDRENITAAKASPTDEGEAKFYKLLNERVKLY